MHFLEWVKQPGNKVLVTERMKNANAVIRNVNRKAGIDTARLKSMTIRQIAEEVVLADMARKGIVKGIRILKPESCVYLLNHILCQEEQGLIPKESYCIQTTEAVYQSMQQIRMNHRTEQFVQEQEGKAAWLKRLLDRYEAALEAENVYDEAGLLTQAMCILERVEGKEELLFLLPWLQACNLAQLEDTEFSALEQDILVCLQKFLQVTVLKLEYYACEPQVGYRFFRGYGIVNEVQYVVKQILEKKLSFGDVNLFYTQKEYEPFIKGLFEKHHIAYRFVSGENLQENHLLRFVLEVLRFAEEDFLYERLADVVENPCMTLGTVAKEAGVENYVSPVRCYNHFLRKGIGWGLERYESCVQRVEQEEDTLQKYKCFVTFLRDLTEVFQDGTDCELLYERLLGLVGKYTYANEERNRIFAVLREQKEVFAHVERQENLLAAIRLLKDNLNRIEVIQDVDENAVSLIRIQNREVLERAHNFFIGLSAKQFMADVKESPVLSDRELQIYVEGKVELAKEAGTRVRKNILGTLATLDAGTIYMGYSTFDTVDMKEYTPSVLYLDCLETWGKTEEIEYQGYEIVDGAIKVNKWQPVIENEEQLQQEKQEECCLEKETVWEMSPSALHMLIDCPLRYYYHYVKGVSEREYQKKSETGWLNAAQKGNLFHHTLQAYCEEILMQPGHTDELVNMEVFGRIFAKEVEKMSEEQPYLSQAAFEKEKQEAMACCLNYLTRFQKELAVAGNTEKTWKVLGCEAAFEKEPYVIQNPEDEEENFTVNFKGSIDRLDGYVDEQAVLHLRVIDYKTGDLDKFAKALKDNRKLQHCIYTKAALTMATEKKQAFEELLQKSYERAEIETVQYVFPYEEEMILEVASADKKYQLPESVDFLIVSCLGPLAFGNEELAHEKMQEILDVKLLESKYKDLCKYCTYDRQCRRKLGEL